MYFIFFVLITRLR